MMTFSLYEYKVYECLLEKIFSKEKGDFGHKKKKKRKHFFTKKKKKRSHGKKKKKRKGGVLYVGF
jgi:hypothetical protein